MVRICPGVCLPVCGKRTKKKVSRLALRTFRTALDDLVDIATIERPEDKHCYMVYEYKGGLKVPSWMVSDGTLRLTGANLACLSRRSQRDLSDRRAGERKSTHASVATVYDSLSSVYAAQVLLATHSPVVLSAAKMGDVLCFAKDDTGATDIVLGSKHPKLQQWHGEADLGTLLASGVLG